MVEGRIEKEREPPGYMPHAMSLGVACLHKNSYANSAMLCHVMLFMPTSFVFILFGNVC